MREWEFTGPAKAFVGKEQPLRGRDRFQVVWSSQPFIGMWLTDHSQEGRLREVGLPDML
jgi:hypothetical protein